MAKRSRNTVKRKRRRLIFGIELVVLLVLVGVLFVYANITNKLGKIDISDSAGSADVKVNEQVVGSKVMKGLRCLEWIPEKKIWIVPTVIRQL